MSGDHLLVAFCNGVFRSFDRNTGKLEWEYDVKKETGENSFHAAMVVSGDMVIAATELTTGSVYAFACDSCRVIWRRPCGPGVFTDLAGSGERVFVHTLQDSVLCLDRATGRTIWAFAAPGTGDSTTKLPLSPAARNRQLSPALAGDMLLYVDDKGTLRALRATDGGVAWERRFEEPVTTSVSLSRGIAYVGTRDKVYHGVVPATGELRSRLAVPGVNWPPLFSSDRGMVGWAVVDTARDATWQFVAYDRDMSRLLWMKPPPDSGAVWGTFRPPIVGRLAIAGTNHGHVLAYDLESGTLVWDVQIEDRPPGPSSRIRTSRDVSTSGPDWGPCMRLTEPANPVRLGDDAPLPDRPVAERAPGRSSQRDRGLPGIWPSKQAVSSEVERLQEEAARTPQARPDSGPTQCSRPSRHASRG